MKRVGGCISFWLWSAVIILAVSLGSGFTAHATEGTALIGIGALQKGTGGAGVASPQDMTWVLLNPASIIDLGCRLDVNLELFMPYRTIKPRGLFGSNTEESYDDNIFYIPSLGYSKSCGGGDWAWGIGLYGVSGMGVEYRDSRTILPKLTLQNYDRRTRYSVATLGFGYARDLGDGWTIGIAPRLNFSMFATDMLTLKFRQVDAENSIDTAYGAGFSLGFYKRWQRFGIGLNYTSRQWMTEYKKYDDLFFESMDLPQNIQTGIAFDITPSLEWVLDYKWIDWDGIDQMGREPIKGGFGWKDQHIIKSGLTWYATPKWTFRGGVSIAFDSPIREEYVFANALFPAVVKDHVSLGVSRVINDKSDIHVTVMHAFNNHLEDNGRGDLFSILGKGTEISLRETTVTFEYSYKFEMGGCAKRRQELQEQYEKNRGEGRF